MRNIKKTIFILICTITFGIIFSCTNVVKANSNEITIEYNEEINAQILEDIKVSKFKVLSTPKIKVEAIPTQEDITKYYYNQLKSDISRNTYNTLSNQISNKVVINLNNTEYSIEQRTEPKIVDCFKTNLLPYVIDGYEAYIMDDASNYWWNTDFKIGEIVADVTNGKAKYKSVEIISKTTEWSDYANFNKRLNEISNSITGNNVYEIARSINYYICNNVEYKLLDGTNIEQTAYGALMLKKAVCEGQTQLFNLICRKKGVLCINIYGYTSENNVSTAHAWNYVYDPSKEKWYAVDVTWNNYYKDPAYLMVGTNTTINGTNFGKNHLAGFKQYTLQTYTPSTPNLALERYIDAITIDGNYIKNVQPNTTYNDFVKEFSREIQFEVKENNNVVNGMNLIKTGQMFISGGKEYILVVIGDTNGDGKADLRDMLKINKHRLKRVQLTNSYLLAADTNKDGKADLRDMLRINKYRFKKIKVL